MSIFLKKKKASKKYHDKHGQLLFRDRLFESIF